MMNRTFIINGKGGAGKNQFITFLQEFNSDVTTTSSVGEIKRVAKEYFGWNGEKTDESRKFLSDLKDMQTKANNGPFEYMKGIWKSRRHNKVQFFHIREPEEIEKFKALTGATTVLVEREVIGNKVYGNSGDDGVDEYKYDIIVYNTTLELLKRYAKKFNKIFIG